MFHCFSVTNGKKVERSTWLRAQEIHFPFLQLLGILISLNTQKKGLRKRGKETVSIGNWLLFPEENLF